MKSEQMLEEDAIRFDTFLKENDKKAHEAIKRAEKETKLKQDKVSKGITDIPWQNSFADCVYLYRYKKSRNSTNKFN